MMGVRGHFQIILQSFLWGGVLLIGADVLGRLIQPGQEIPVGAMTAYVGGPWLLYLAWKTAKSTKAGDRQMGGALKPIKLPYAMLVTVILIVSIVLVAISYNGMSWSMEDRKSTRLNSSHVKISYAVFCLKKKKLQS